MVRLLLGLVLAPLLLVAPLARPAAPAVAIDRHGSVGARYNFPPASRGDRFARGGLNLKVGIHGWRRYGKLIKQVAGSHAIDPYVLGAYVWVESEFDAGQDYTHGDARALGLGSVQASDHPGYAVARLKEPRLNLSLTAREFAHKWHPHDMAGTVMDVWYPRWRKLSARGEPIPVIHQPGVYVQAIANRYYALHEIDRHFRSLPPKAGR